MPIHLSQLWIYPIKSCAGTRLNASVLDARGLQHDRRWMVVDVAGKPLTQRELPALARVRPSVTPTRLLVDAPGMPPMALNHGQLGGRMDVEIWGTRVEAACLPKARAWFRRYTGRDVDLVFMPDSSDRLMNSDYGGRHLTFVDGNPLHLINDASLADLNARLAAPVSAVRFRPNLVLTGARAYAEDGWSRIVIGDVTFSVYEACIRCVVVNIDPVTTKVEKEPLATLARYRRTPDHVAFGQNLVHLHEGVLRENDRVHVISAHDSSGLY